MVAPATALTTSARLHVPKVDPLDLWPTLGFDVADWIEAHLVHGPGDMLGKPVTLTEEARAFIASAYEVFPHGHRRAGRRRFKRAVFSRRKGASKTELAALIAIAELDPAAPVRCQGWRKEGRRWVPVGGGVHDPYIPMVATTEEQSEDLAYGAVLAILEHCELGAGYYLGQEEIHHRAAPGVIKPMASSPKGREGARTTFQHFDETHLFTSERLREAHRTMLQNILKRVGADSWSLETTTMYAPGDGSVAEATHHYAEAVAAGQIKDAQLLFDHLQASGTHDLTTKDGRRAALRQASGDAWAWTDVESVLAQYSDPQVGPRSWRRFWLNMATESEDRWLDVARWDALATDVAPAEGTRVVLAFAGNYRRTSTALVGCTVDDLALFVVRAWEAPERDVAWRTPSADVDVALTEAMETYDVAELAVNPTGWHRELEEWEATYGDVVVRFETSKPSRFGPACDSFAQALADDPPAVRHDGDETLTRHLKSCVGHTVTGHEVVTAYGDEHIEAAKAAIVAYARAHWHLAHPPAPEPKRRAPILW
ncbi:MAG TPA: hypothetical protein VGR26_14990 [Acidimicrobiales bacterium]|nr:hypothetical protein [Acidimicrobiales bacterium]